MSRGKGKRGNRAVQGGGAGGRCRSLPAGRRDIEMAPEDPAIKNDRTAAPTRKFTTFFSLAALSLERLSSALTLVLFF